MVCPEAMQSMRTGPLALKKMVNMVLGSNLSRRTTVLGDSPSPIHVEFDFFAQICRQ